MDNINDAISNAYFADNGFRSIQHTYRQAKAENPDVTLKRAKDWFERAVARKTNLRGYNSFVASKAKQEYQADLFFMTSGADVHKRKCRKDIVEVRDADQPAILMTDVFSKLTKVLLIDNKQPDTVLHGLRTLFDMMGGKPEVLYTDEEGSFLSNLVKKGMDDDGVRLFPTMGSGGLCRAPDPNGQGHDYQTPQVQREQGMARPGLPEPDHQHLQPRIHPPHHRYDARRRETAREPTEGESKLGSKQKDEPYLPENQHRR
jgi:hypothetical protein